MRWATTSVLPFVCFALGLSGCNTIIYCAGSSPYPLAESRRLTLEAPDIPDVSVLREAATRVTTRRRGRGKDWDEVGKGLLHKVTEAPPPGQGSQDFHWIAWDEVEGHRVLYVVEQHSNEATLAVGESWSRTDVYDAATGERLASWGRGGYTVLLVFAEEYVVKPAEIKGVSAVRKLMSREIESGALEHEVREGSILALGVVGWGRSNHRRYLQLLWIPIPIGSE